MVVVVVAKEPFYGRIITFGQLQFYAFPTFPVTHIRFRYTMKQRRTEQKQENSSSNAYHWQWTKTVSAGKTHRKEYITKSE